MAPITERKLTFSLNMNTVLTTVSAALIVIATTGIFAMKNSIVELQKNDIRRIDAIDELQRGVNRLQNKVDEISANNPLKQNK